MGSLAGGFVWNGLNKLNEHARFMPKSTYVGGDFEPHGLSVVVWSFATLLPILAATAVVVADSEFWLPKTSARTDPSSGIQAVLTRTRDMCRYVAQHWQIIPLCLIFLLGAPMGALVFYDFPVPFMGDGVRSYLHSVEYSIREFALALMWSGLIAIAGFSAWQAVAARMRKRTIPEALRWLPSAWSAVPGQVILCVGSVILSVTAVLLAFPVGTGPTWVRGTVAGFFLRLSLFLGLSWSVWWRKTRPAEDEA